MLEKWHLYFVLNILFLSVRNQIVIQGPRLLLFSSITCMDPWGDKGSGPLYHKNVGFLDNSGPDLLENHKAAKPA